MKKAGKIALAVILVLVLVIGAALLGRSMETIQTNQVALKYDRVHYQLSRQTYEEGLHTGPPGFQFISFPKNFISLDFPKIECLNKDGVSNELDISFEYRVQISNLYEIVTSFEDKDNYEELLKLAGSAAIHDACSLYNTSQFQAERGNFQEDVVVHMNRRFEPLYAELAGVQVRNIQRPKSYDTAVQQKETARENVKVKAAARPQNLIKAETRLKNAEKQAEVTVARARSRARIIRSRAMLKAEAIVKQFAEQAETYQLHRNATPGEQLSDESFLAYLGIRTIASVKKPVYIGMKSPAKTSYLEQ